MSQGEGIIETIYDFSFSSSIAITVASQENATVGPPPPKKKGLHWFTGAAEV